MRAVKLRRQREVFGVPNERGFVPILLETLRVDSIPDFDLYNRVGRDYILYRAGSHPFTEKQRQALLEHGVKALYVPASQIDRYWHYLERNITPILADPLLAPQKKAEIFHATSIGLTREIFNQPRSAKALRQAGEVVKGSAELLLSGKPGFHAFLQMVGQDSNLYTHSVNVCTYGIALAKAVGITDKERIQELGLGLLLHDLGMTEIPEEVLSRPGPLSTEQWQLIRSHPRKGAEIYRSSGGENETVLRVILTHHERVDGSGYPEGLVGREIPLVGRIAAIANVFDALTTARPFRPALTTYAALTCMKQEMGSFLDGELLDAFICLLGPA